MSDSAEGRRVLVAVVTGQVGDIIQAWREIYDPRQARRLPPHTTLCYWAPGLEDADALDLQIRHAFPTPLTVSLGEVDEFDNRDGTFFIEVTNTTLLNEARARLYDATRLAMPGNPEFTWHITCVRYPDLQEKNLLRAASADLNECIAEHPTWLVDTIAWLELRSGVYEPIRTWTLS